MVTAYGERWLYYHRRISAAESFRLCRVRLVEALEQPVAEPECFAGAGWDGPDLLRPVICRPDAPVMFYERFDGDRWAIYATEIPKAPALPAVGQRLDLEAAVRPPLGRPYSYRYPACNFDAFSGMVHLGFSMDFDENAGEALEWNVAVAELDPLFLQPMGQSIRVAYSPTGHERRIHWGQHQGLDGYFLDRESGLRGDIVFEGSLDAIGFDLVANGALNLQPVYLPPSAADTGSGLLAYQSDRLGSFDIYVLSLGTGGQVRVTSAEGWEGSAAWLMAP